MGQLRQRLILKGVGGKLGVRVKFLATLPNGFLQLRTLSQYEMNTCIQNGIFHVLKKVILPDFDYILMFKKILGGDQVLTTFVH
jgi:hypothetical protein